MLVYDTKSTKSGLHCIKELNLTVHVILPPLMHLLGKRKIMLAGNPYHVM